MNKTVKIALIATSIIGVGVGAFFAIKFYKLKRAAQRSISLDELNEFIKQKTKDLDDEFEEDDAIINADKRHGDENNISIQNPVILEYDETDPETWSDEDWDEYYRKMGYPNPNS